MRAWLCFPSQPEHLHPQSALVTEYSEAVLGTLVIPLWKVGHCVEGTAETFRSEAKPLSVITDT